MAESTGAPGTVGLPVGRRRAGGMYLFGWLDCSGGYSIPWRRTPLYLLTISPDQAGPHEALLVLFVELLIFVPKASLFSHVRILS